MQFFFNQHIFLCNILSFYQGIFLFCRGKIEGKCRFKKQITKRFQKIIPKLTVLLARNFRYATDVSDTCRPNGHISLHDKLLNAATPTFIFFVPFSRDTFAVHSVNFQGMAYFCEFTVNYKSICSLSILND